MTKIFIETVGCPKNQEDSEKAAGLLNAAGNEIVAEPEDADVIIVNTCGFIEAAKTLSTLRPGKEDPKTELRKALGLR